eukprot:CAMPEP_0174828816 /NCGR_PEP_ID=MMETSP1114-20130205/1551_1 /TAXON_ID=312471 /ORGANISM="Neobodo designis, Strain CCAP 1951/1" /LENGTH=232 /DNA_ID=CAMNT_0016062541 /DNA_START=880 /DNA_END=1578 /DNA_ORIENTATION=+
MHGHAAHGKTRTPKLPKVGVRTIKKQRIISVVAHGLRNGGGASNGFGTTAVDPRIESPLIAAAVDECDPKALLPARKRRLGPPPGGLPSAATEAGALRVCDGGGGIRKSFALTRRGPRLGAPLENCSTGWKVRIAAGAGNGNDTRCSASGDSRGRLAASTAIFDAASRGPGGVCGSVASRSASLERRLSGVSGAGSSTLGAGVGGPARAGTAAVWGVGVSTVSEEALQPMWL